MQKIITISREYGAGGHSIGKLVADALGIPLYDRDIVEATAKASGYEVEQVESEGEEISRGEAIWKKVSTISGAYYRDTQQEIRDVQRAVILNFAKQGPCVLLGRCAEEILREAGMESLNVFIHADEVQRAKRVGELLGTNEPAAIARAMARKDSARHNFYQRYTGKVWGDSRSYHLTLDSGELGYDKCAKLIVAAAKEEE